jgi:hypothetical protein
MGFGESSLDFELRCRINRIDRRFTVQSDINFALEASFKEAEINIPFPQRDLHIISHEKSREPPKKQNKKQKFSTENTGQPLDSITRSHREEVELNCEIDDLWKSLTELELQKKWLIDDGKFTKRIGSKYNLELKNGDTLNGHIDVLISKRKIRLVEAPRVDEEPLLSGPITIEFLLDKIDEKTKLTVTVEGIPATEEWEEDFNRSQSNWNTALNELKAQFAER